MTHSRDSRETLRQARAGFAPSDADVERVGMALEGQLATLAGLEALGEAATASEASAGGATATSGAGTSATATASGGAAGWLVGGAVSLGLVVAASFYVASPASKPPEGPDAHRLAQAASSEDEAVEPAAETVRQAPVDRARDVEAGDAHALPLEIPIETAEDSVAVGAGRLEASAPRATRPFATRPSAGRPARARDEATRAARSTPRTSSVAEPTVVETGSAATAADTEGPDSPIPESHLQAELRLIERASQALRLGDAAHALRILRLHEDEYPDGSLKVEREGLLALASCAVGETRHARVLARRFLRAHAASPLASRVQGALQCEAPQPSD